MFKLEVDNTDVLAYTQALKKMHRSNFPIAVRNSLNDAAFDVKKNTLLQSADKEFILRNPGFFIRYSGVKKAVGWNANSMKSEVGIIPQDSKAAEQLSKQEEGGKIADRSFIYMETARIGNSEAKLVKKQHYINRKKIVRGRPNMVRSKKAQYVADAIVAEKEKKSILKNTGEITILFDVVKIKFGKTSKKIRNRKVFIKLNPIASYEKAREVNLKKRPFLRNASINTYRKMPDFFIQNAKKQIKTGRK